MQTASPLDDQIDGRQIGDHQIDIEIQTLLQNLRTYQHPACAILAA